MRKTAISERRLIWGRGLPYSAYCHVSRRHDTTSFRAVEQTKALGQRADHAGRGAPDEIVAIGHGKVMTQGAAIVQRMALVVGRIEQEGQRHLKDFSHLEGIGLQVEWRPHQGNHRRDRSEEHTSELQSHHELVCRLLLEKK